MKRRPLSHIIRRFFLNRLLLPILLLVFTGAFVLVFYVTEGKQREQINYAQNVARYVSAYLENTKEDLSYIASFTERIEDFGFEMSHLTQSKSLYQRIVLLDSSGKVVQAAPQECETNDCSGLISGIQRKGEIGLTAPYYSAYTQHIVVGITWHTDQDFTLLVELNLEALQRYIADITDSFGEYRAFITDTYGNVIAHPDMSLVQEQQNLGYLDILSIEEGDSGRSGFFMQQNSFQLMSATMVPNGTWKVVVAQEAAGIFAPVFYTIAGILIFLLFFIFLVSYSLDAKLQKRVVEPLSTFSHMIEKMKYNTASPYAANSSQIDPESFHELHSLYTSFLEMQKIVAQREEALRSSERNLSTTLYSIGDAVITTDPSGNITRMNQKAEELSGWNFEDVKGRQLKKVFKIVDAQTGTACEDPVQRVIKTGKNSHTDMSSLLISKQNSRFPISSSGAPIRNEEGTFLGVVLVFRDISAQHEQDEKLKLALQEKEILLQEMHHRVKNNLNVVASLLSLQADHVESVQDVQDALADSKNRIYSMALVHEDLYKTESFSEVNMGSYINSMVNQLIGYFEKAETIRFHIEAEDIPLGIVHAVPCGIIINELLTNSLKYAFPNGSSGEISVQFALLEDGRYQLRITDNGIGLPEDIDPNTNNSLGLKLVRILTSQIDGDLQIHSKDPTEFAITFHPQTQ